ncbi:hypothetical protein X801_06920 [Opisthorchis viverrini]|nr:hypothetical protein X801_06920 [Opisthorchis viverrini]
MPMITGYLLLQDDPSVRPTSPTVLILHGNAGNIGHRLPFCRLLADHVQCNILIVDYRGYGRSSGKPTEPGLYADAKASLEFLLDRTDIAKDKLFLFGRSIGGAVAIWLTAHLRSAILRGVIIENSFTSLPEAAQHIFSKSFGSFARHLLPKALFINKYPALDLMREFVCRSSVRPRFLFISGSADDLIPPRMMQELAHVYRFSGSDNVNLGADCGSASPSSFLKDGKDGLVCFPGGQHNNTWLCPDWGNVVSHFIEQACACPSRTVFSGTI